MSKIILKNVRLSFPALFTKEMFEGKEGKFAATLLIDKKDTAIKKELDTAISALVVESKLKIPKDNYCLKDGDEIDFDGYKDCWSLKASNAKRPTVIDRDKTPLTADDNKIYAGCYVNAIIDFWIQNNSYGKRVNANLYGIQFLKDGEPFGQGPVDVMNDFEDLDL